MTTRAELPWRYATWISAVPLLRKKRLNSMNGTRNATVVPERGASSCESAQELGMMFESLVEPTVF